MNATPETTIKGLIPEGWEFNGVSDPIIDGDSSIITIHMSKIKDMYWYTEGYIAYRDSSNGYGTILPEMLEAFEQKKYTDIPFEIKIGLLRFICDDLGIRITRTLGDFEAMQIGNTASFQSTQTIIDIVGTDFINSINLVPK